MALRGGFGVGLTVLGLSCSGGNPPPETVSLVPTNYATAFTQVRGCRSTIEHASAITANGIVTNIRVLINPSAAAAYLANAAALPVGTVVIKEESDAVDCSHVTAWSVNVKEAPGYDPSHHDWHWQRVLAGTNTVLEDGIVNRCIACHTDSECLPMNRDLMCTVP